MDRKNINRGFKKLRVWQDAVSLYILACKMFTNFPFELKKVAANSIDAAHSMSRNISEGYCRRSLKEYLNHLNIALTFFNIFLRLRFTTRFFSASDTRTGDHGKDCLSLLASDGLSHGVVDVSFMSPRHFPLDFVKRHRIFGLGAK